MQDPSKSDKRDESLKLSVIKENLFNLNKCIVAMAGYGTCSDKEMVYLFKSHLKML